jgi:uncharacterized protein DUF6636
MVFVAIGLMLAASYDPVVARGVAILFGLLALAGAGCSDEGSQGPLPGMGDTRTMTSATLPAGTTYVVGFVVPKNTSDKEAVLESLEPGDPARAKGLRMRYAAVPLPSRGCQVGSAHGWPPLQCAGKMTPVDGFRVPVGATAQILVGALTTRPGHWVIPEFRLRYRVGDTHYERRYAQGMQLKARPASTKFVFFQTPSHNIGCVYETVNLHLRCDILSGLKPPPSRPPGCQNDWTFGYQMDPAGHARKVCAGDTVFSPSARVIRYGTTWRGGPFTCKSRRSGLRCRNRVGHGFFLSRQHAYRF